MMKINGIAPGGTGYGEQDGRRIYVSGALPGDSVKLGRIREYRGRRIGAARSIERGDSRREAPCELFGRCGGCAWQDVVYSDQVRLKREIVAEAFREKGMEPAIEPILPSPEEFRYRNRVDFAFGNGEDGPVIGLYERSDPRDRSHQLPEVCPVTDCRLVDETTNAIRGIIEGALKGSRLRAYNPVTRSGVLRSLEIRKGQTGHRVSLTVANDKHVPVESLGDCLKEDGRVDSFAVRVSRSRSRHAPPKREIQVFGADTQTMQILDSKIAFSGGDFSQVNTHQIGNLYRTAVGLARPSEADSVLDLYCGVGALSIALSRTAKEVRGIERENAAVITARSNATVNEAVNCVFEPGDAADLKKWGELSNYSVVTVNPPRAGLDAGVVEGIAATRAERVVYVSCNPETLARDCKRLTSHHYAISSVHPVDMFPQTIHVETVVLLERVRG